MALWVTPDELEDGSGSPYAYEACKTASFVLWAFSGRKYGGSRTVTETYECPCVADRWDSAGASANVRPYLDEGLIRNEWVGGGCDCAGTVGGRHVRLRLRGTPVTKVHSVKRGGVTLDPSEYKVVNSSMLQLTGNVNASVCGLEVSYSYGVGIPTAGKRAARYLASQFVAGWSGEDCNLPDRVTNVSREGISFTVIDQQEFLDDLRTGVYEVDLFLRAVNPDKARKPARVFSPDLPKAIRTTVGEVTDLGLFDFKIIPSEPYTWNLNLATANADILADAGWQPQGQISSWNGAVLLEFNSDRFEINDGVLSLYLTAEETAVFFTTGNVSTWDLYGLSTVDGFSLVHILTSNIYVAAGV